MLGFSVFRVKGCRCLGALGFLGSTLGTVICKFQASTLLTFWASEGSMVGEHSIYSPRNYRRPMHVSLLFGLKFVEFNGC